MVYYRNNLILGAIGAFFKVIGKAIFSVISFLNLQYALLVVIAGLIVYLTGAMNLYAPMKYIFIALLILAIILGIIISLYKVRKKLSKHNQRGAEVVANQNGIDDKNGNNLEQHNDRQEQPTQKVEEKQVTQEQKEKYPKYFTVKQNHDYFFVEYEDRYELYKKQNGTNIKVRTDYKK